MTQAKLYRSRSRIKPPSFLASDIDPLLGVRFSGLTDGEGHFAITRTLRKRETQTRGARTDRYYGCAFMIRLRRDDEPMIQRFRDELGVGQIYRSTTPPRPGRDNLPASYWKVENKLHCLFIVELLELYPLWSTKARDFEVWAKAVRYWANPDILPRPEGSTHRRQTIDWEPLAAYHDQIREARQISRDEAVGLQLLEERL